MAQFSLEDRVVQSSIKTLTEINERNPERKLVIVGGIACQLYCTDPKLYRPTNDVDILFMHQMSAAEFKDTLGKDIACRMAAQGYPSILSKGRGSHEVATKEDGKTFYIHVARFSKPYLGKHKDWKSREIDNAKTMTKEGLPYNILVHRIEDIMANKSRRLRRFEKDGHIRGRCKEEWETFQDENFDLLANQDLQYKLQHIIKESETFENMTVDEFAKNYPDVCFYKVHKDLYDIALLCRTVLEGKQDFDIKYLRDAIPTDFLE